MNLSSGRERRSNAGNRMAAMIRQEQAKIASGELSSSDEEQDQTVDAEALNQLQDVEDDQVDSDFAETDSETERIDQQAAEEEQREPKRQRQRRNNRIIVPRFAHKRQSKKSTKQPKQIIKPSIPTESLRVSSRTSAMQKAEETRAILSEREVLADLKKHSRRRPSSQRAVRLTQEQLLEEAKQTEKENLRRLRDIQHQRAVQQRRRQRETFVGGPLMIPPVAHWKSTTAQQVGEERRIKTVYQVDKLETGCVAVVPPRVCAVTGQPARYMHPRARVPFADVRAYGVLEKLVRGEYAYYPDLGVWNDS